MYEIIISWINNPWYNALVWEDISSGAGLYEESEWIYDADNEQINDKTEILAKLGAIKSEFDRAKTSQRSTATM